MSATKHAATLAAVLSAEFYAPAIDAAAAIREVRDAYHGVDTGEAIVKAKARKELRPETVAADALELISVGKGVARWAVRYCNGEGRYKPNSPGLASRTAWDETDDAAKEKADAKALAKLQEIANRYGATVKLGGDPRGYVVKLILASGRHNTWGGAADGWGVA